MRSADATTRARVALGAVIVAVVATDLLTLFQYVGGSETPYDTWLEITVGALSYGGMGYVIATKAAGNRLGPLMLALGLVASLQGLAGALGSQRPESQYADALGHVLYALTSACQVIFVGGVIVLLLLAPTGRPLTPRWRWAIILMAAGVAGVAVDAFIFRQEIEAGTEPTGVGSVVHGALTGLGSIFWIVGVISVPLCLALRWFRVRGLERQQVTWVVVGGLAGPLLVMTAGHLPSALSDAVESAGDWLHGSVVWALAGAALPAGIAIAVLRHRLYDIDRLVSRTTSYVLVSSAVIAVYLGVVTVTSSILPVSSSITVAMATLAAAAAFRPLLRRTRSVVDRRFNRAQYDAEQTVHQFAERLRAEVDPDVIVGDLLAVLQRTVQPSAVGLWVRK